MAWRPPELDDPNYGREVTMQKIDETIAALVRAVDDWNIHDRENVHASYIASATINQHSRHLSALTSWIARLNQIEEGARKV